jgi:DNA repair protein RadC
MVQNTLFKVAEVSLVYSPNYKIADRPKIKSADEAYKLLMNQWDCGRIGLLEDFKIILLTTKYWD